MANTREEEPRVNSEITTPEILLIDEKNAKRGVVNIQEALRMAEAVELDLVEVAPQANPPVCRIMNYGKYRFQQQKRDKEAHKKQKNQVVKEIKMRPKIDLHDYDFKVKAIQTFLQAGNRVKVSVFFRGREMAFLDRGREVLSKVAGAVAEFGRVETEPRMEGSYMRIMIAPNAENPLKKAQQRQKKEPEAQPVQPKVQKAKAKKSLLPDADQI
ncbi:translation initiation factor IF-3 [Synergistes jonesii]|uniref:translation initiation factor IF-3 n=1 Tax=Synergistes jonesii TaxID=2754 RepID=UPI00248DAEB5|nr:translation initiation factor IF-3 [Synergistes jonesii]